MDGRTDVVAEYLAKERENIPREVLELAVLAAYRKGMLSAGKSAQLLGISHAAFLALASREGIAVLDETEEELAEDLRASRDSGKK